MNSQGVKSGVPERVSISCPTCGTCHDLRQITVNQSYATYLVNTPLEIVSISCPTCGTCHDLHQITVNQSYATFSEHTIKHVWHYGAPFVK